MIESGLVGSLTVDVYLFGLFFTLLGTLILIFMFRHISSRVILRPLTLFTISGITWTNSLCFLGELKGDLELATLIARLIFVAAASMHLFLLEFIFAFCLEDEPVSHGARKMKFFLRGNAFLILLLSPLDLINRGVSFAPFVSLKGPLYYYFLFSVLVSPALAGWFYLYRGARNTNDPFIRFQFQMILRVTALGGAIPLFTNGLIPALCGTSSFARFGPLGVLVFVAGLAHALARAPAFFLLGDLLTPSHRSNKGRGGGRALTVLPGGGRGGLKGAGEDPAANRRHNLRAARDYLALFIEFLEEPAEQGLNRTFRIKTPDGRSRNIRVLAGGEERELPISKNAWRGLLESTEKLQQQNSRLSMERLGAEIEIMRLRRINLRRRRELAQTRGLLREKRKIEIQKESNHECPSAFQNDILARRENLDDVRGMLARVGHELQTPIAGISLLTRGLLARTVPGVSEPGGPLYSDENGAVGITPEIGDEGVRNSHSQKRRSVLLEDTLKKIERYTLDTGKLLSILLMNVDSSRQSSPLEYLSLRAVTQAALDSFPYRREEWRGLVRLVVQGDFYIYISSLLFTHIIYNLLKNSLRAIEIQGEGDILIVLDAKRRSLRFRDSGCGIDYEAQQRVFQEGFSLTGSQGGVGGLGLGLSFVRDTLEDIGASIELESRPGEFTEFLITFPGRTFLPGSRNPIGDLAAG